MSEIRPLVRKENIVVQELECETLVYDLKINKALVLNQTSAMVWQLCDGKHSIEQIADVLSTQIRQVVTPDFVWLALEELKKENLIKIDSIISTPFEGLSRREMVRKIGFASIIALPVIGSLVAPIAVQAGSCAATNNNQNLNIAGCPCGGANDCAPNPPGFPGCCGVAPNGSTRICVKTGSVPPGQICRAGCECSSGNCPPGSPRVCTP